MKSEEITHASIRRGRKYKSWVEVENPFWYAVCVLWVGLVLRFWVRRYRAFGASNVPSIGGSFVICNHTTAIDPFLLGFPIWRLRPRVPGKIEFFRMPVVGFLMRNFGSFPLRQEIRDPVAVRTMIALYRAGKAIMIFPEGMRSKDGELLPFFPDFARLMIKMRARMVPAAIAGGSEVLPIGSRIIRPRCPVTVVYGEPFDLAPYFGRPLTDELLREAAEYARSRVAASLEVAREERRKLAVKS